MLKLLTDDDILNSVRMARKRHRKIPVFFEGSTDIRVYEKFLNLDLIEAYDCNGKSNAVKVYLKAKKEFTGALAIIDADFSNILHMCPKDSGIIMTDTHDLETLIINSECFDRVYEEFGVAKGTKEQILDHAINITIKIGTAKLWSQRSGKLLKYRGLEIKRFIDYNKLDVDLELYLKQVIKNSSDNYQNVTANEVIQNLKALKFENYDCFQICSGHDLVEILTILFQKRYGNIRGRHLNEHILDGILRLSYTFEDFKCTKMYEKLKNFQNSNGLKILK